MEYAIRMLGLNSQIWDNYGILAMGSGWVGRTKILGRSSSSSCRMNLYVAWAWTYSIMSSTMNEDKGIRRGLIVFPVDEWFARR